MMRKHAGDVFAQHEFNQKLLSEHSAQLETEDHLYRLSGNMESALRQETREFDREWTEVNRRVSNVEKELLRMMSKLAEAKRTIQFDEDSLRKWEEKLTQKEEDNQLIEDYMKQDTQKYKVQGQLSIDADKIVNLLPRNAETRLFNKNIFQYLGASKKACNTIVSNCKAM